MASGFKTDQITLFHLNDDCIILLFHQLYKHDQVSLALTCQRFRDIFVLCCKRQHEKVEITSSFANYWKPILMDDYFKAAGACIKSIEIKKRHIETMELVGKYCSGIESIRWWDENQIKPFHLKSLNGVKSIKYLDFVGCMFGDDVVLAISEIPSIEGLCLGSNGTITGKYLNKFTHLKVLSLRGCGSIKPDILTNLWTALRKLEELDLTCNGVTTECLNQLVTHCNKLQKFYISCTENEVCYEVFTRLPSLRQLELWKPTKILLNSLIAHKALELESLRLFSIPRRLEDELGQLISQFINLKTLEILYADQTAFLKFITLENLKKIDVLVVDIFSEEVSQDDLLHLMQNCANLSCIIVNHLTITNEFFARALNILQSQKQRQKPVRIFIDNLYDTDACSKSAEYLAAKTFLQIIYPYDNDFYIKDELD